VVYLGGGTPKNFIQQSSVVFDMFERGHKYAIQFTADAPHWGGLSGCTFAEAKSWGKIQPQARLVTVHVDATIALPIVSTALAQSVAETAAKRKRPGFELDERTLKVGGKTVTALRKYMIAFAAEQAERKKAEATSK
jgi:deoxyhypusine synthase